MVHPSHAYDSVFVQDSAQTGWPISVSDILEGPTILEVYAKNCTPTAIAISNSNWKLGRKLDEEEGGQTFVGMSVRISVVIAVSKTKNCKFNLEATTNSVSDK